jgi:hypothetical protein
LISPSHPPALALRLVGQHCRVICDDPAFQAQIAARYAPFLDPTPLAPSDLEVTVTVRPRPVLVDWEPRYVTHPGQEPLPHPPDYDPARDGPLAAYEATATPGGLRVAAEDRLRATLDLPKRRAWITQEPNIDLFHTALRQFLAYLLPFRGGCLLHAAGVVLDGRAVGLFGVSGSGKSTLARLAPGPVLTDESLGLAHAEGGMRHVALARGIPHADDWWAYTTPFWGEYDPGPSPQARAPLAAVFHVVQAPVDRATRLPGPEALLILSQSLMYHLPAPAYEAALLGQAAALLRAVPCYRLEFRPSPAVWEVIAGVLPPAQAE